MSADGIGLYSPAITAFTPAISVCVPAVTEYIPAIMSAQSDFGQEGTAENTMMAQSLLRETAELLMQIASVDDADKQQYLLGRLVQLQNRSNTLVAEIGVGVKKLAEGGFGLHDNQSGGGSGGGIGQLISNIVNGALLIEMSYKGINKLSNNALKNWINEHILTKTAPFLTKAGGGMLAAGSKMAPYLAAYTPHIVTGLLAAGGVYYLSTHNPDWVTYEPKSKEELDAYMEKGNAGLFDKQDFIQGYGDTPSGRSAYLSYLAGNNASLYEQEKAITDQYVSFSEAERIRIEKGLPETYPKMPEGIEMSEWFPLQGSILYPDTDFVLGGNGMQRQSPFAAIKAPNDSAKNVLSIGPSPYVANPLTGAREDAAADFSLPYDGAYDTQNRFSDRLADALERLAEVCGLPRVSVGTLAETAVIREEADLDALARRFADELLRAQLVS